MNWYLQQVGGVYDDWKVYDQTTEKLGAVVDPEVAAVVALKYSVIEIAEELGIGNEVSKMFDAYKIGSTIGFHAAATGTTGAIAAVGITAGLSAGVIGAAVALAFGIFGGDGDEEVNAAAKKQKDRIRASLWQILNKPTLSSLAAEQDEQSYRMGQASKVILKNFSYLSHTSNQLAKLSATSSKLAAFYRKAAEVLSPSESALFLASLWLGRLVALRDQMQALKASGISDLVTIPGGLIVTRYQLIQMAMPELDAELGKRIPQASAEFEALSKKTTKPLFNGLIGPLGKPTAWATWLIPFAVGAGALWYFQPELARKLLNQGQRLATNAVSSGTKLVKGAASQAKQLVNKVT